MQANANCVWLNPRDKVLTLISSAEVDVPPLINFVQLFNFVEYIKTPHIADIETL